jgi:hypothetical protein
MSPGAALVVHTELPDGYGTLTYILATLVSGDGADDP